MNEINEDTLVAILESASEKFNSLESCCKKAYVAGLTLFLMELEVINADGDYLSDAQINDLISEAGL